MSVSCDLHLHSCLSPCADNDMTPFDLVGMSAVNGLELVALTDHNSARNCPAAAAAAAEYGIGFIPGMEVTTAE
ncbi:MAG: PHP domain-containing protein, partial [Oscillospiraceae bacterium]